MDIIREFPFQTLGCTFQTLERTFQTLEYKKTGIVISFFPLEKRLPDKKKRKRI
jgi:hypothetical protein